MKDSHPDATAAIRGLFGGQERACVQLPGDPGYDLARLAWNRAVDQRPAAVVTVPSAAQIPAVIEVAAAAGLRVAPQRTGHNAGPLDAHGLRDAILLRTQRLNEISVDPSRDVVRVAGGSVWGPVVAELAPHGRAVLHGSAPTVGVAGYTLGGGIGWYGRKHGLGANSVTAVELVTGDGTLVRADAKNEADLFWAIRGGGGNFGVVTALEFRTYDIESTYAGAMMWDIAGAERVVRTWFDWAADAPDEATTSMRVVRLPSSDNLPEATRGRRLVVIDGAVLGSDDEAQDILAPLLALRPEMNIFRRTPTTEMGSVRAHSTASVAAASRSASLPAMSAAAVDAFLDAVGPDSDTQLLAAEMRQLGGAFGRPADDAGVLSHLDGLFVAYGSDAVTTAEFTRVDPAPAGRYIETMKPYATARPFLNFVETPIDTRTAFEEDDWHRLVRVRSAVDPTGVIAATHPVPHAGASGPTR